MKWKTLLIAILAVLSLTNTTAQSMVGGHFNVDVGYVCSRQGIMTSSYSGGVSFGDLFCLDLGAAVDVEPSDHGREYKSEVPLFGKVSFNFNLKGRFRPSISGAYGIALSSKAEYCCVTAGFTYYLHNNVGLTVNLGYQFRDFAYTYEVVNGYNRSEAVGMERFKGFVFKAGIVFCTHKNY